MIEVEKNLFDHMIAYINGLATFVSAVGNNELKKASEVKSELIKQRDSAKEFAELLTHKAAANNASAKSMAGFKSSLRKVQKIAEDIRNGLESGVTNRTKYRADVKTHIKPLLEQFVAHSKKFAPTGVTEEALEKEYSYLSTVKTHRLALSIVRHAIKNLHAVDGSSEEKREAAALRKADADAGKVMQGYLSARNKLPHSLRGRMFAAVKMPIVPYFGTNFKPLAPTFLRKTGIDFQSMAESFVIFQDQFLLAFDYVQATEYKGRKTGLQLSGLKARKRAAKHQTMQEDFVIDILERLNAQLPVEHTLASSHFELHPNNPRIAFAWLMPKSTYRMFERTGDLSDSSWGFPWGQHANSIL